MFALTLLPLASLAISSATALVVPRKNAPAGWAHGYLEDYDTYHIRYLAIGCHEQHNTQFFDQCCHPMLATENLVDHREPWCTPSASASASASAAEPTSTIKPDDEALNLADCDESEDDDYEDGEDDEEYCDNEDDTYSESYAAPTVASTTPELVATSEFIPEPSEYTPEFPPTSVNTPEPTPAPATSEEAPEPSPVTSSKTSEETSGSSGVHTGGFATFYFQNGVAGACGDVHSDGDLIVAIDSRQYGDLGKQSSLCGKRVRITNPANQKQVDATIEDACPTCNNSNSLDLSYGAFTAIATEDEGLVGIEWTFI